MSPKGRTSQNSSLDLIYNTKHLMKWLLRNLTGFSDQNNITVSAGWPGWKWGVKGVLQSVAVCYVACCSVLQTLQCVAVCCSVLHCVAACCSVLQCVAVCCSVLHCVAACCGVLQFVAACCLFVGVRWYIYIHIYVHIYITVYIYQLCHTCRHSRWHWRMYIYIYTYIYVQIHISVYTC